MTFNDRAHGTSSSGFTLVEAILVVVILGIVGLSSSYVIVESITVYARTAPALDVSYQLSLAVDRMQRDIRDMESTASITSFAPDKLAFTDVAGDSVTYANLAGDVTRTGDLLARGAAVAFRYWAQDGTVAATANQLHLVEIDMKVVVKDQGATIQTMVFPRMSSP